MTTRERFYDDLVAIGADKVIALREIPWHMPLGRTLGSATYGVFNMPGGFTLRVWRAFRGDALAKRRPFAPDPVLDYYLVEILPAAPPELAERVNATPHDCVRGPASGAGANLGAVARVAGVRGGATREAIEAMVRAGRDVTCWHADSLGAVSTLVRAVRRDLESSGALAADTGHDVSLRRAARNLARLTAPGALGSGSLVDRALREVLHDNLRLDERDAEVIRLRAMYPRMPAEETGR